MFCLTLCTCRRKNDQSIFSTILEAGEQWAKKTKARKKQRNDKNIANIFKNNINN